MRSETKGCILLRLKVGKRYVSNCMMLTAREPLEPELDYTSVGMV